MTDGDGAAGESMRERGAGSRWRLWLLLDADRLLLAALLLAGVFCTLVALGALADPPLSVLLGRSDPVETLFQALVTAIITGVTLVVTISQLVLSQELGAVGDQRERMAGAMDFRREVEDLVDEPVSPPDPAGFLRAIVAATGERARAVADVAGEIEDGDARDRVREYAEGVADDADAVTEDLADAQFGTFDVVLAALHFNYAGKIYEGRRLRERDLPGPVTDRLEDLVTALTRFGPAREHVKTLYFQWELITLSRTIVYAAVPALVVSVGMILTATEPGSIPGTTLGVEHVVVVVAAATTVALLPFALLLVYILRIVTVAQRTLAIGPLVLRETDRSGEAE
ncbi:MAG: hypothetical protein ABEJ89_06830 [Haloarculaceae archaeon]